MGGWCDKTPEHLWRSAGTSAHTSGMSQSTFSRSQSFRRLTSGEVTASVSGRTLAPFPTVNMSTSRAATMTLTRVDAWLVDEARAELAHRRRPPIEAMMLGVQSADPKNPSPADRDTFNAILFDEAFWETRDPSD